MPQTYIDPYSARQQSLNRRRQMAQLLQQQAMAPLEEPNYPGAQISPWQGVAKMAQALISGLANRGLDKEQTGLSADIQGQRNTMMEKIARAAIPEAQGTTGSLPMAPTQNMPVSDRISPTDYPHVTPPPGPGMVMPEGSRQIPIPAASADVQRVQALKAALADPLQPEFGQAMLQNELLTRRGEGSERAQMARLLTQQQFQHGENQAELGFHREVANAPNWQFHEGGPGQAQMFFNTKAGPSSAVQTGITPMPTPNVPVDQQELQDYLKKNPGKGPADFAGYKATLGQRPQRQVLWGDDPNNPGKQIPYEYDENSRALSPIPIQRTPTAQLNVIANEDKAYDEAMNSVAAMEGLAKRKTYAADQAMADQFFNVVKPGSGARMNQAQIDRFMTPGPIKSKMQAWAQKLDQGQPLDDVARADLVESARIVAQSKKPKAKAPAANDLPTVGGTFNGAKVLKVTPWPN